MASKIIIRKSKPNFFSVGTGLFLFYFAYNYYSKGSLILALIALTVGIIAIAHIILLLTTPLLVHEK